MSVCEHLGEQPLRFPAQDYITGQAFSVHTCRACGLVLTLPVPSPEAMSAHYPEAYYGTIEGQRFPGLVEALQARLYQRRVRRQEGRLRSGGGVTREPELRASVSNNVAGKTICAFGEACSWPTMSFVAKFREEFAARAKKQVRPFTPPEFLSETLTGVEH